MADKLAYPDNRDISVDKGTVKKNEISVISKAGFHTPECFYQYKK
jgi:hypothetical protein